MKPKTIVFDTYHLPNREQKTLWADVWVSFTAKPGRKRISFGPTLSSKTDVQRSLECEERYRKAKRKRDAEIDSLKALLASDSIQIDERFNQNIPTLYWPGEWITRESEETLIAHWLKTRFGFQKIRAKWKRNRIIIGAA